MLSVGKNTFKVYGIVYKICMETKIQWYIAHKGRQIARELFLKLGLLLTKYRIDRVRLESEEVVIYETVSTHAIIEFLLNRR